MSIQDSVERAISGLFLSKNKSSKSLTDLQTSNWPANAEAYEVLEDCGRGVSATVYRAYCIPREEVVAIKKMNLEAMGSNLDEVVHEAQLMKNYHHPNILPLYTSFVHGSELWMVMPFISGGSVLHIIKYAHPEGLEEVVIATIMRDVLKALDYVHRQGGIHRDIKAGNILVNHDGTVKMADFGVATSLERSGSWGHSNNARMTFVGTPCWMAPEVMEQTAGYDNAADIWSFGIAMLEMAHGHAPFAKYPPMKVLLMTLQNPPPSLEDKGKKHFSKAMRDVVTRCLQKDPRNRPTAFQLLEHKFFKQARDEEYLAKHLMAGLPSLGDRVQEIRQGKAATLPSDNDRNFARSQEEYMKGVSSWNFDIAALKAQADLEADEDSSAAMLPTIKEYDDEMSLSCIDKVSAEEFLAATLQASAPSDASANAMSAFATRTGQAATVATAGSAPLLPESTAAAAAGPGPGSGSMASLSDSAVASPAANAATRSPSGGVPMSRESSQAIPSTKLKTKGRFTVHDDGEPQQPLSTSSSSPFLAGKDGDVISSNITRDSEDGSLLKKEDRAVTFGDHVVLLPAPTDDSSLEPKEGGKKKGRFTVIENNAAINLEQRPTHLSLSDISLQPAKGLAGTPPGPGGHLTQALIPRLHELLDHAAAQQTALQRLVVAVQESDRSGKLPASLRMPLFEPCSVSSRMGSSEPCALPEPNETSGPEELRAAIEHMQGRLAEVEAENARLKARNAQLEGMVGIEGGGGQAASLAIANSHSVPSKEGLH